MPTTVITGGASGIGAAAADRLRADGHRVVIVDRAPGADVEVDLATETGRATMVDEIGSLRTPIHGVVAAAGIAEGPGDLVARVNFYGAIATLDGLRPLMTEGGAAVAISSNSTTTIPAIPGLARALIDGSETDALALAAGDPHGMGAYPATKLALARWVRRQAVTDAWIGADIRLNAIAPGYVDTPMTAGRWTGIKALGDRYPIPAKRPGRPEDIAALIGLLLSDDGGFFVGSMLFCDGGTDAAMRPDDWPSGLELRDGHQHFSASGGSPH